MELPQIAQPWLLQAQQRFDQAATGVTRASLPTQTPPDSVSLSDAAVSLLSAKDQFQTELIVAHVADQMDQGALNLLG